MSCASCAQTIEKTTKKLPGVKEVSVNLATEKMHIQYDEASLTDKNIKDAVSQSGYKVVSDIKKKTFIIEGMTCASCAQTVEKATGKLPGIVSAAVNLATEKMAVQYDPEQLVLSDITNAVKEAGYEAHEEIETADATDLDREKKAQHIKDMWQRFWISAVFTVPLLYISMGHMLGMPLPEVINPMMNAGLFALTQLILTLPVLVLGREFFKVGFKALVKGHPNMDSLVALGTSAAFLYSLALTIGIGIGNTNIAMNLYYESAAVILTLITLGKYFEALSKGKTSEAIKKLIGLAPKKS